MRRLALGLALVAVGCGANPEAAQAPGADDPTWVPPAESCSAVDLDHLDAFAACTTGSGSFGQWVVDDNGLPAYDYKLDENADARAAYPVTETDADGNPVDRRDHWAAFGNRRVNAMAYNDGYIEVVDQDRGVEYLDKFDASQGNLGGGFGWIDDGDKTWCTAYKWRPRPSLTTRRFGIGYAESSLDYRGIKVTRVTSAPPGDTPVVLSDVTLENHSGHTRTLRHYEYWDVGRRPIEINWLVSGDTFKSAPASARQSRDARNGMFGETVGWNQDAQLLGLRRTYAGSDPRPDASAPDKIDYYPGDPFLAETLGDASDVYTDQAGFFGQGGAKSPDAVTHRAAGGASLDQTTNGLGQPRTFVIRSDVTLAPDESKTLRFAYGFAKQGDPFMLGPKWRDPDYDPRADYAAFLKQRWFLFGAGTDPFLHRELAWDSAQVEASVGVRQYWQGHVVPQGSAYLYLHGADGATRDLALFAVPLVYTDPALAKEELRLMMGLQYPADGHFSYAFQGNGMLDDAGVHKDPSDLSIFFAWAVAEYLGATGDTAFLDEVAPFYPREALPDATVWDHVVKALRHQLDDVGTGPHGLIRLQSGDWSDGITVGAPDAALAAKDGESVPNTEMACAVFPRLADIIQQKDAALADELRAAVTGYRTALADSAWGGSFFYRAYFGDGKPVGADSVDLESQIWALVGDTFSAPDQRATLVKAIADKLDDPSPTGATLTPGGEVWPAISAPLTWGYALSDPDRAWAHFAKNTLAAHAEAFPDVWYGIWSAPDGLSSQSGLAWKSQVTPMTDFPVQNNNAHAMPILAALRIAGIDATATGLDIAPHVPAGDFALRSQLVDLSRRGNTLSGVYRPSGVAARTLVIHLANITGATLDGKPVGVAPGASSVSFLLDSAPDRQASFEVTGG